MEGYQETDPQEKREVLYRKIMEQEERADELKWEMISLESRIEAQQEVQARYRQACRDLEEGRQQKQYRMQGVRDCQPHVRCLPAYVEQMGDRLEGILGSRNEERLWDGAARIEAEIAGNMERLQGLQGQIHACYRNIEQYSQEYGG